MTVKLKGSSSGSVALAAPASTAGGADRTLTLPDKTATLSPRIVLEQFWTPCDGSTITTSQGDITVQNVTAAIDNPESYTDLTGSVLTYTPPAGTTQVIYEFQHVTCGHDAPSVVHYKLMLAGVEVTDARKYESVTSNNNYTVYYKWGFNIGGSADAATGRVASWTSGKELKWQLRDYNTNSDGFTHQIRYWDGADVTDFVTKPCVGITAIG